MQAALDSNVRVNTGVKVDSVDTAETAILLANGDRISADIIIAADGLHVGDTSFKTKIYHRMTNGSIAPQSVVRSHVLDSRKIFPRPSTGQSAIRFMLPKSVAQSDNIISGAVEDDVHMISWKGDDKRILVYPVDYDRQFNVTCTYPSKLSSKQTCNDDSAAIVGTKLPVISPQHICLKLTLLLCSIQPKDLFRRRS